MKNSLEAGDRIDEGPGGEAPSPRIILVGARRDARKILHQLRSQESRRVTIVGFVDAGHRQTPRPKLRGRHLAVHPELEPVPVVGGLERLHELVERTKATDVVVAVSPRPTDPPLSRLAHLTRSQVKVHWVPSDADRLDLGALPLRREGEPGRPGHAPSPWARAAARWMSPVSRARAAKRLSDVVVSGIALLILSPLFAVVAVAIFVTSGRPIFYSQERVGQWGRRFRILKFRSMRTDAERDTGPIWASNHDARCTRIGDWLRHTNIDELPQLFNVFKGDMSLVGPRPERPHFVEQFCHSMPEYDLRHAVPAGMTGWAQVHGWRGRTSLRKRIQYDLDYLRRWTFWLDFVIMLMTVQHVAWGKISWNLSRPPKKADE